MKQKLLFLFLTTTIYLFCMEEIELSENIHITPVWTLTKMKEIADNIESNKYDEQLHYYTFKPEAIQAAICYLNDINTNYFDHLSYFKDMQKDKTSYHHLIKKILCNLKNDVDKQQQATSYIMSTLSKQEENLMEQREDVNKSYVNQRFIAYSLSVGNILVGILATIWGIHAIICLGH